MKNKKAHKSEKAKKNTNPTAGVCDPGFQDTPEGWTCAPCREHQCEECMDPVSCECSICNG
jgi:hypothetical protein